MARRQSDARRARLLAGLLVVGLVAGAGIVLILGAGGGTPALSPSPVAALSPSPPASPADVPTPTATLPGASSPSPAGPPSPATTPTGASATVAPPTTPGATPAASPPPATPAPTVAATPGTAGPRRELTFHTLGIDNPVAPEAIERLITFGVDGPGEVSVNLSQLTAGRVRMCLWQGDAQTGPRLQDCTELERGSLTRNVGSAVPSTWNVSLIGSIPGRSPSARVRLRFPSHAPEVHIAQFRFQGIENPAYNGFTAELTADGAGSLRFGARLDDEGGGSYPYVLRVDDLSVPMSEPAFFEDTSNRVEAELTVEGGHRYLLNFENQIDLIVERVLFDATLRWP